MSRNRLSSPLTWPVYSFALTIAAGALLLNLPICQARGNPLSLLDALFLATSAVCVTGLTPVDIGATLSPTGQGVLLFLIQTGGLGVMTYTSIIFLLWRDYVPFNSREAVSQSLLGGDFSLKAFLCQVIGLVFGIEAICAVLLHLLKPDFFPPFSAVFHAVSAFCNAGFSLNPHNLMAFRDDVAVNAVITGSVFLGGIGFGVLREMLGLATGGRLGAPVRRLSRFSRLVLKTSFFLIFVGAGLVFTIEFFRLGNEHHLGEGFDLLITSFFQSVSARTAGFNTVDILSLSEASLLVYIILMFIGGGPGSCAGGIKVVAFRVLAGYMAAQFRGDRQIILEQRGVPEENVTRALTLFFLYTSVITLTTFLLAITENGILQRTGDQGMPLFRVLFEAVSALGTVGLSANLTPELSSEGKIIIIINMFAGRVGLLSLLMAIQSLQSKKPCLMAESQLPIG
ncbi:MAG: ATPase [Desulfovibrio sp.]|jgi:trk system potassium uptake protein TrkH|nr:ATPase [Desulfovibrio sp.]